MLSRHVWSCHSKDVESMQGMAGKSRGVLSCNGTSWLACHVTSWPVKSRQCRLVLSRVSNQVKSGQCAAGVSCNVIASQVVAGASSLAKSGHGQSLQSRRVMSSRVWIGQCTAGESCQVESGLVHAQQASQVFSRRVKSRHVIAGMSGLACYSQKGI